MARPLVLLAVTGTACLLAGCSSSDSTADRRGTDGPRTTRVPTPAAGGSGEEQATTPGSAGSATPKPTAEPSPDASSNAPVDGGATVGGPARCTSGELVGSLEFGPGAGAAGSSTGTLTFRNDGGSPCSLAGYPGVSLVDQDGHQLGAPAARADTTGSIHAVTLQPGGTANAVLRVANVDDFSPADCRPAAANGLRIYPPGSRTAIFVQHDLRACTTLAPALTVGPVVAPASGA